jgi:hypothetical protein
MRKNSLLMLVVTILTLAPTAAFTASKYEKIVVDWSARTQAAYSVSLACDGEVYQNGADIEVLGVPGRDFTLMEDVSRGSKCNWVKFMPQRELDHQTYRVDARDNCTMVLTNKKLNKQVEIYFGYCG